MLSCCNFTLPRAKYIPPTALLTKEKSLRAREGRSPLHIQHQVLRDRNKKQSPDRDVNTTKLQAVGSLAEETIIHSSGQLFWEGFSVFCQSSVCVLSVHASVLCYHGSPNPCFSAGPPILPQGSRVAESTPPNNGPCTRTQTDCF